MATAYRPPPTAHRAPAHRAILQVRRRTQALDGADEPQCVRRVARDEGGSAECRGRGRFGAEIDQDRAAAGAVARLAIVEDVADEPGAREVEVEIGRRTEEQARLRLWAIAADAQGRRGATPGGGGGA